MDCGAPFLLVAMLPGMVLADPIAEPGPWSRESTSSLPLAEGLAGAGATVNARGGIVVAGGGNDDRGNNLPQNYAFLLDPGAGAWLPMPPLQVARYHHGMARDNTGRPVVFGGYGIVAGQGTALASVEAYDEGLGAWVSLSPMPIAQYDCQAVADRSAENIFLIGGNTSALQNLPSSRVFRYHVPTDTWTEVCSMNHPRMFHGAALGADGRIYALGGWGGGTGDPDGVGGTVERMDPSAPDCAWELVASMNAHPHQVGGVASDGCRYIYALGGWDPGYSAAVERYDILKDQWEPVSPLVEARNGTATLVDTSGRLLVIGGELNFDEIAHVDTLLVTSGACSQSVRMPRRGDANGDGRLDMADAVYTLLWILNRDRELPCPGAADVNSDQEVDFADPTFTLTFLFQGGSGPAGPVESCETATKRR